MSDSYEEQVELPQEIIEAMQIFISFLTANFAYEDGVDEVEFKMLRESVTDGIFMSAHVPMMERNNIGISGNDFFNAACILMTDMLYNATSGNISEAQEVLRRVGLAVLDS
jgi:hypothetical protein